MAGRGAIDRRRGCDAIEIGLPFSDPVMDGPVIQQASQMALEAGATPVSILDEARELDAGIRWR
jgi:tryptophan synthase alpha chain